MGFNDFEDWFVSHLRTIRQSNFPSYERSSMTTHFLSRFIITSIQDRSLREFPATADIIYSTFRITTRSRWKKFHPLDARETLLKEQYKYGPQFSASVWSRNCNVEWWNYAAGNCESGRGERNKRKKANERKKETVRMRGEERERERSSPHGYL